MSDDDDLPDNVFRIPVSDATLKGLCTLDNFDEPKPRELWNTGFFEWAGKVALSPGMVSIVTGLPGSGKTHLWAQIWHYVLAKYDLVAGIASFECRPKPYYRRYLRQFFARCPEALMTDVQKTQADRFIQEHYLFFDHPEDAPTLEWFLELAEYAVVREGVSILQIDPWNRFESQRRQGESEVDYISRCLRTLSIFARNFGCHIQILAHPAKRDARRREMSPELEDISGAMHWWNMCDQGFIVHRKEFWNKEQGRCFDAKLLYRKSRFEELGYPCTMDVKFNPQTCRFEGV